MKKQKIFKIIAIASYLLIILRGGMISFPFFFWLLISLVEFGNIDEIFALLAVIGLTTCFIKLNSLRTLKIVLVEILCFILLASPLAPRLTVVPIEKFNYLGFIIPTIIFVLFYFVSIYFSVRRHHGKN